MRELTIREKTLPLPAFVFSVSSHETQVTPTDGTSLLSQLEPTAVLVSAYDAWKRKSSRDQVFNSNIQRLYESKSILFMDSGNYEAYRKRDHYSRTRNPKGWHQRHFWKTVDRCSPDLAFSFDTIGPTGEPDRIAARVAARFRADERALRERDFHLCPIIHLPSKYSGTLATCAARIVSTVAADLDPLMLAIPERELGDGLRERARTVRNIRKGLNTLDKYYPLHLLGTGNPLSMVVLAAAGADAFDGLEWCRTVADYETGFLFHFQQFECFSQKCLYRVQDQKIRLLIENLTVPYTMRTLTYNVDFFEDWTRTMRSMIHSGQVETLLRAVPGIGPAIFEDLSA